MARVRRDTGEQVAPLHRHQMLVHVQAVIHEVRDTEPPVPEGAGRTGSEAGYQHLGCGTTTPRDTLVRLGDAFLA